jgi:hypothetical protein
MEASGVSAVGAHSQPRLFTEIYGGISWFIPCRAASEFGILELSGYDAMEG